MVLPAPLVRSASDHLSLISKNEVSPEKAQDVLADAFAAEDYGECIKDLNKWQIAPQAYIDGLDGIIDALPLGSQIYRRSLRALRKTCGIYGLLPSSHYVPAGLTLVTVDGMIRRFALGGFSDVWKAQDGAGRIFAIKDIRIYERSDMAQVKKSFCKEVMICRRLQHENVLTIEGVGRLFELCTVSKWMDNGNMAQYVNLHPQVDRMQLLTGITRGLHYLHSNEVIHGDLKGSNILIDEQGNPLLADFGLSSITNNLFSFNATTPRGGGTYNWAAPELLANHQKKLTPTTKSDVYSLSMVIVELYSGNKPFPHLLDVAVVNRVLKGERPPKPVAAEALGLTQPIWKLTKRCWHKNAAERPEASEILAHLEGRISIPPPSLFRWVRGIFSR